MKTLRFILASLLLAALLCGCAASKTPSPEPLDYSVLGYSKSAAPYGDGLVFIDFDGRLMHFSGGNTEVIYDARHCYGPIATEGGDILFTRLMSGPWGVEVVRLCENGEITTLETRFDEVYLIANGTVYGVIGGEYIQVSTADGTEVRICEVPQNFSPEFCADGVFYAHLPAEDGDGIALFALSDRYSESSLPPSICFGNSTFFCGYIGGTSDTYLLRRSDFTKDVIPDAVPLAYSNGLVYFVRSNSYFSRTGALCRTDGVTSELLMEKIRLPESFTVLNDLFQVYGDLVIFQTIYKNSVTPSPAPLSLSSGTPIYTYILDTSAGTLHLACEN